MKEYLLDFKKVAYQSVPEGVIHVNQVMRSKTTKEVLICVLAEGENFPKWIIISKTSLLY